MSDFDPVKAGQEAARKNAKADKAAITEAEMNFDQEVGTSEVTVPEGPVLFDQPEEVPAEAEPEAVEDVAEDSVEDEAVNEEIEGGPVTPEEATTKADKKSK